MSEKSEPSPPMLESLESFIAQADFKLHTQPRMPFITDPFVSPSLMLEFQKYNSMLSDLDLFLWEEEAVSLKIRIV